MIESLFSHPVSDNDEYYDYLLEDGSLMRVPLYENEWTTKDYIITILSGAVDRNMVVFDVDRTGLITLDLIRLMNQIQKEETGFWLDYFLIPEWADTTGIVYSSYKFYKILKDDYKSILSLYENDLFGVFPKGNYKNLIIGITSAKNALLNPQNKSNTKSGICVNNKYVLLGAF